MKAMARMSDEADRLARAGSAAEWETHTREETNRTAMNQILDPLVAEFVAEARRRSLPTSWSSSERGLLRPHAAHGWAIPVFYEEAVPNWDGDSAKMFHVRIFQNGAFEHDYRGAEEFDRERLRAIVRRELVRFLTYGPPPS